MNWATRLSPSKAEAISRLREPADRNASLLGLALLESVLANVGRALDPAQIAYPAPGKPQLPAGPDFSVSHAGGLVGCAVALQGGIGFDMESRDAVSAGQLRLALGGRELGEVISGGRDPTAAWVQAEAVLKAIGLGAAAAPRVRLDGRTASVDGGPWYLSPAPIGSGHVAWLAHQSAEIELTVLERRPGEFAELS